MFLWGIGEAHGGVYIYSLHKTICQVSFYRTLLFTEGPVNKQCWYVVTTDTDTSPLPEESLNSGKQTIQCHVT